MLLLVHIVVWFSMVGIYTSNLTDEEWATFLPDMTMLCPMTDICGKVEGSVTNDTMERNQCCLGCSCDESCNDEEDRCCFTDDTKDLHVPTTACLNPSLNQNLDSPTYYFTVSPPAGGCQGQGPRASCSPDTVAAPWGNFNPVYSRSLKRNFKNEACALCHGTNPEDLEHWTYDISYLPATASAFLASLTEFYETYNSTDVVIVFKPPTEESVSKDKRCFSIVERCRPEVFNKFYIPSAVPLDRESIVQACRDGPTAMYIIAAINAYKNVYCAICNGYASEFYDTLKCRETDTGRSVSTSFTSVIDVDVLPTTDLSENQYTGPCFKSGKNLNASRCVQPECPALQVRVTTSGKCEFPAGDTSVSCLTMILRLSTGSVLDTDAISSLRNMTDTGRLAVFTQDTPWSRLWKITSLEMLDTPNKTEFRVTLHWFPDRRFSMPNFTRNIEARLLTDWKVRLNGENIALMQEIVDQNRLEEDIVQLYYSRLAFRRRFCLIISLLFFCEQIKLTPSEFTQPDMYRLYVVPSDTVLYKNEYMLIGTDDGYAQARVCVKDSGYVRVDPASSASHVKAGPVRLQLVLVMFVGLSLCVMG